MTQKKKNSTALIAGILFAVWAVLQILQGYFVILRILYIIGIAVVSFSLITKRRDIVPCAGFAVLAIAELIWVINGLKYLPFFLFRFNADALFFFLGYIAAALICFAELTNFMPKLKGLGKKIWFVPAILFGVGLLTYLFSFYNEFYYGLYHIFLRYGFPLFAGYVISAVGMLLAMMWVVYPEELPKEARPAAQRGAAAQYGAGAGSTSAPVTDEMYCGMAKHVLLLLFTFGIWYLIWIYRVTGYTNCFRDEEDRNPATKLLLCMFVPFYHIYWTYKTAQRIEKMAAAKGLPSDLSTLCLILAIFVPIIPPILMQDKLNSIAMPVSSGTTQQPQQPQQPVYAAAQQPQTAPNVAEELKSYKELLDMGVLTQEEFDAKKKQLLEP